MNKLVELDRRVSKLEFDTAGIRRHVRRTSEDVAFLKLDLAEVKGDVTALKIDMGGLKTGMAEVKLTLDTHGAILDAHTAILGEDSAKLNVHGKLLQALRETQVEQGQALNTKLDDFRTEVALRMSQIAAMLSIAIRQSEKPHERGDSADG